MRCILPTNKLCLLAASTACFIATTIAPAQGTLARRAMQRIQANMTQAESAIYRGIEAEQSGDYESAVREYQTAVTLLPDAPATATVRDNAKARYVRAGIIYARQRGKSGRMDDARVIAATMASYDPDNRKVKRLLADLDDPLQFPIAVTSAHVANVEEVNRQLKMGQSFYEIGDLDRADVEYTDVLRKDKYNRAARRGQEKVEQEKQRYYDSAYDHTRASMLSKVDAQWETAVPPINAQSLVPKTDTTADGGKSYIIQKLNSIIIPQIQFADASLDEAIEYLVSKSKELDNTETDPAQRGVNIIIRRDTATTNNAKITLTARNMPLVEALRYVTELAGMKYKVEPFAVLVVPITTSTEELFSRTFKVPPDFIPPTVGGGDAAAGADPFGGGGGAGGPGGTATTVGGSNLVKRAEAKAYLVSSGIPFPEGASATFNPQSSQLIVRNTTTNLDLIDQIVQEQTQKGSKQVYITTKFVEVSQRNTEELGFDWLLGGFNLGSTDRVFGGGGTAGNSANGPVAQSDYTFTAPGSDLPIGGNPLSRGLRFGNAGILPNSIDALLNPGAGASTVSPGIFSLAGVFTDPEFQVTIRALSQRKGVDLMTAPSITAKPGTRAKIEVIREFIYPTEFDPPEIPQNFGTANLGNNGGGGVNVGVSQAQIAAFPVTPTTPTAFEMRPVGVSMEVDPVVSNDNYTIDLNLAPEVVEFEGFVNYGSPIQAGATDALGNPTTVILTENRIPQPIFSTRKVQTAVTIWDGQTVAIGGLIREDVQTVNDKVPFLGDLPYLGRLFRTKAEDHFKRNLIVFVTAKLIDPSGQSIRNAASLSPSTAPIVNVPGPSPALFPSSK